MPWKNIKIREKWVDEIKETINRYPNDAINMYLRQFGLPVYGGKPLKIDRIIHSMLIAEKLKGNEQKDLKKKFPMPVGEAFKELNNQIKSLLKDGKKNPNFETLMNFIDKLAMTGYQNIFFYKIRPDRRNYLNELKNKEIFLKSLKEKRLGACFNKSIFVWNAKNPKLAAVRHKYESERGELLFKWIETRSWRKHVKQDGKPPIFIPMKERSVNFFRVNLGDGTAEIRIQRLNNNPAKSLEKELKIYHGEIRKLLDFDLFSVFSLDSVMKKLLKGQDMQIKFWDIRLKGKPKGKDKLSGNTEPSIFNKLELGLKRYSSHEIHGEWTDLTRKWGPVNVLTEFDGRKNEMLITRPCDALQLASILRIVKGSQRERIQIPEIRKLVEKRKDLKPILKTIDSELIQSKEKKVSAAELEDLWFQMKAIIESFLELSKISPKFKVQNDKKEKDQSLIYEPTPGGLIGWMERKLGKKFSKTSERAIPSLVYLLVIIGLCWMTAKLFLPILKEAGTGFPFIALTYLVVLTCILAFAIPIFGKEEVKYALKLIIDLIKGTGLGKLFRRKDKKE